MSVMAMLRQQWLWQDGHGSNPMKYQLVLQFAADSTEDFDRLS